MGGYMMAVKSLEKIPQNKASEEASAPRGEGAVASYKKGGKVKRTGVAKLHKGEQVLKKSTAKKYRKKHRGKGRGGKE
jgi:exonuclease VII small subunit